jgi:hypothetical protein
MDKRLDPDDISAYRDPVWHTVKSFPAVPSNYGLVTKPTPSQQQVIYMDILLKLLDKFNAISMNAEPNEVAVNMDRIALMMSRLAIASIKLLEQETRS